MSQKRSRPEAHRLSRMLETLASQLHCHCHQEIQRTQPHRVLAVCYTKGFVLVFSYSLFWLVRLLAFIQETQGNITMSPRSVGSSAPSYLDATLLTENLGLLLFFISRLKNK